jgi:hypothetical protein
MSVKQCIICLLLTAGSSSCVTYHISTESLKTQVAQLPDSRTHPYPNPPIFPFGYMGVKPSIQLNVVNKKGQPRSFFILNKSTIRVTQTNGRKSIFGITTLRVRDSVLLGVREEFLRGRPMAIPFNDIIKIEAQQH